MRCAARRPPGPGTSSSSTAGPTAETLRLLALPEAIGGYLERLFPAHRRAVRGLLAAAGRAQRGRTPSAGTAPRTRSTCSPTTSPACARCSTAPGTGIRLVLTPERMVAAETRRTLTALALHGLRVDGLVANRLVPAPATTDPGASGAAAHWLGKRAAEQAAVLADLDAAGAPVRTVGYRAAEPDRRRRAAGAGRRLWGGDDPAADPPPNPPTSGAARCCASGGPRATAVPSTRPSSWRSACPGPLPGPWTSPGSATTSWPSPPRACAGVIALPAALRRCTVTGARLDGDDLCVGFRPDPARWMR